MKPLRPRSEDTSNSPLHRRLSPARLANPHKSTAGFFGLIKRIVDFTAAATAIVLLSPLLAALAVLIRLKDGTPVIFRQTRVGLNGRHFTMLKFRTMIADAEKDLGPIWAVPADPRCTAFGAFQRRFGLDKLPQLWNVVRGEMSLIGPGPERPEFTQEFAEEHPHYDLRHTVRGGITGYAQVHGWRGFTGLDERLHHDLHYVNHWSLQLDLYIVLLALTRGWSERTRTGL